MSEIYPETPLGSPPSRPLRDRIGGQQPIRLSGSSRTGYGPAADELAGEVTADNAKDRLIAELRAENATLSRNYAGAEADVTRLERELAEARAAITAQAQPADPAQYAVVEAMGHRTLIGAITDATIAGAPMLRVTRLDGHGEHYVSPGSLYCVTPCSQAQAQAAQSRLWTQLPATVQAAIGTGDDDQDDADDPYTEAGRDYQRAEMAREDARDPHAGCAHDDEDDDEDDDDSDVDPF